MTSISGVQALERLEAAAYAKYFFRFRLLRLNVRFPNGLCPFGGFTFGAIRQGLGRAGLGHKTNVDKLFLQVFAARSGVESLVEFGDDCTGCARRREGCKVGNQFIVFNAECLIDRGQF